MAIVAPICDIGSIRLGVTPGGGIAAGVLDKSIVIDTRATENKTKSKQRVSNSEQQIACSSYGSRKLLTACYFDAFIRNSGEEVIQVF